MVCLHDLIQYFTVQLPFMEKLKNIIAFLFPILFFSLLTLYLIQSRQIANSEELKIHQAKVDSAKMGEIYGYLLNYGNSVNVPLTREMQVTDSSGRVFLLGNLIKNRTFIFHFDETNCFDCVEKYLPYVKKLATKVGKGNVIILGSFGKKENLFLSLDGYNLNSISIYNLQPSYLRNTRIANLNMPFMVEVDSQLQSSRFFIPEKALPKLSDMYNNNTPVLTN